MASGIGRGKASHFHRLEQRDERQNHLLEYQLTDSGRLRELVLSPTAAPTHVYPGSRECPAPSRNSLLGPLPNPGLISHSWKTPRFIVRMTRCAALCVPYYRVATLTQIFTKKRMKRFPLAFLVVDRFRIAHV
jgi:hypothetical protein